jgi:hypothetical protein
VVGMTRGSWWLGRCMTRLIMWRLRCMGDVADCVARCDTWKMVVGLGCDWSDDVEDDVHG